MNGVDRFFLSFSWMTNMNAECAHTNTCEHTAHPQILFPSLPQYIIVLA